MSNEFGNFNTAKMSTQEAYELVRSARGKCPVAHSDEFDGFEIFLDYNDVKQGAWDWRTFSSTPSANRPVVDRPRPGIDSDPPFHTEWRKLINTGVDHTTPGRIEAAVRADVDTLIDALEARESFDLVTDYAEQVPLLAVCHVLDIDASLRSEFHQLSGALVSDLGNPEKAQVAFKAFAAFVIEHVVSRRGSSGDDFPTKLANAEFDGRQITDQEIVGAMIGLLVAGHETTIAGLSGLLFEVLSRPKVRELLRAEPERIPVAVEEALRLHPPIFGFFRQATDETEVSGVNIAAGQSVYLCWAAANRDPNVFENPDEFQLDRPRNLRQLAFGFGIHACPGAPVARMEMRVALERLLERLPSVSLVEPDAVHPYFNGSETMGIRSLPARLDPARI